MLPDCIAELQGQMAENSINAMVILKPENSFLTSGLNTIIQSHPVIVIMVPNQDPILLVYALRHELAQAKSFLSDIRLFGNWSGRKSIANTWQEALGVVFRDLTLPGKVIGFERGFVSGNRCDEVAKALPWASLVDVSPILLTCRQIKDEDQIVNARRAGKVADIGMAQLIKSLREGATERRACIMSTHEMNLQWDENEDLDDAEVCGFGSLESGMHNSIAAWMMSGPRKFLNCASPIKRVPRRGETVSAFIWVPINGIWSEIERTICMGEVPEVEKKALKAIHEIRAEILPLYRPGTRVKDIFATAVRAYAKRGYGTNLPGRIGHGVGLGPHEEFSINATSEAVLQAGMIVTLEPHIQVIEDGVGIVATQFSDTLLIIETETGHKFLTIPSNPEDLVIHC